jgi:predicted glycosyltransferase
MRVWIDLANSPHVPLMGPIVRQLSADGHEVILTARNHAQTAELARGRWQEITLIGGDSPEGRLEKGLSIVWRAERLRRFCRWQRPDVAFSHGSYAQLIAARATAVPGVTMMDYEHQPANHVSFRAAQRVIVPSFFPNEALRRFGARSKKVVKYEGFKEELYLAGLRPNHQVLADLGLDHRLVIAVFRPPPDGALYHRLLNRRFDEVLQVALARENVQVVLLPRTAEQRQRYASLSQVVRIPKRAIDASSLLALADLVVGAGGTMNRESAILGTPTYTVFAGQLGAADAQLIKTGRLNDLREANSTPRFDKKSATKGGTDASGSAILGVVLAVIEEAAS